MSLVIKGVSRGVRRLQSILRVAFLNVSNFGYYDSLPLSTIVYGRVLTLEAPTRLKMGAHGRIGDSVYFATGLDSEIILGSEVFINIGCVIVSSKRIEIGSRTSIAEYVTIRDQEHEVAPGGGTRGAGFKVAPIQIGKNVWIGRGVYIGPGTRIGDGCVIGANSVVHGTFPSNVLIAGAPATVKRDLT